MEEYLERLEELCRLHGVIPPKNILDLNPREFGVDRKEVDAILDNFYELYFEKCDWEEYE
jgi:hypothetical protein